MTPPVIQRWIDMIDNHSVEGLEALLADDAVFYSPAIFAPQEGRAKTAMYLTAAAELLGNKHFRYVGQWFGENSAVLEFVTDLDGVQVNGVDMIQWNDDGKIVEFKVMLRPFKAMQTVMAKMAELLALS
jgi:hypothetical protein